MRSHPSAHDGTLNGPGWSTDLPPGRSEGTFLSFDGTDDVVTVSNLDIYANSMSLTAWVKFNSFGGGGSGDGRVISKATGVNDIWLVQQSNLARLEKMIIALSEVS